MTIHRDSQAVEDAADRSVARSGGNAGRGGSCGDPEFCKGDRGLGEPRLRRRPSQVSNPWISLQRVQDDFLTPRAIVAEGAAKRAFLEVQDDFLPLEMPQPARDDAIRIGISVNVADPFRRAHFSLVARMPT